MNRRGFLQAVLGAGLTVALGGCGGTGSLPGGVASTVASETLWLALQKLLIGPLLRPGQVGYVTLATPSNLGFTNEPAAIAHCASVADVQACVRFAHTRGIPMVARSGGHSYAGYSNTVGLQIDVSRMTGVEYDPGSGLARLQGGARNANVYASLGAVGRTLTHGRCKSVGVAGLVLGGGIGFNMRRYGLTCDNLVDTEVVIASGDLLRCNAVENSDLFWACRGAGGGNFGIHTSFTFNTFPADAALTVFSISWLSDLDALLPTALTTLPTAQDGLGIKLSVTTLGILTLLGQLAGTPAELRAILDPLYQIATPDVEYIEVLPYWEGQEFLSEPGEPAYYHERSRYAYLPMPAAASVTILEFLRHFPGTSLGANWKFFLSGGAIDTVAPDQTAFVHRGATLISSIELDWSAYDDARRVAAAQDWLAAFHEAMRPYTSDECFVNFIDGSQTDYLQAYYGANLDRLRTVKRRYDPDNFFNYPQSIPV